jgi:rod shape-determining protein MreC
MPAGWKRYWEKTKDRWLLITVILFSLLFMVLDQTPPVQTVKRGVGRFMGVFRQGLNWAPDMMTLRARHREALVQLGLHALERDRHREALLENQQLRRLLGFSLRGGPDCIPAEVTGHGTVGFPGTVHLNAGWRQGCRKNMPLITERGLVGRILSVNATSSVGLLITDPNSRISARIQRSRVVGIMRWLSGNVCLMEGISQGSDVRIGDTVITSGFSDFYPSGLTIGTVFEVSTESDGLFRKVLLRTEVDLSTLEYVLILKNQSKEIKGGGRIE